MAKLALTLACGDYEIVRPLKEGAVQPDGIDLTILTDMDSTTRHWRFLRNREFDVAETSASSFIVGRDQDFPFLGIPGVSAPAVSPRVHFHQYAERDPRTEGPGWPKDRGEVLRRDSGAVDAGILEHEYGVPHRSVDWYAELDEDIDFTPPADLKLTRLRNDQSVEEMLATGELDAVLHSSLIKPMLRGDPRVGRLFPDYKSEEVAYYQKTGVFPIMHVLGIKAEILEAHPWAAINLYHAFERAKALAMKRMENPENRAARVVSRGLGGAGKTLGS